MTQENNKPVATIRCRDIKIAVWQNANSATSFTLERIYKSKSEWKSTSSFGIDDFSKVRRIFDEIETHLFALKMEGDLAT